MKPGSSPRLERRTHRALTLVSPESFVERHEGCVLRVRVVNRLDSRAQSVYGRVRLDFEVADIRQPVLWNLNIYPMGRLGISGGATFSVEAEYVRGMFSRPETW